MSHTKDMIKVLDAIERKLEACDAGMRAARRFKTPESLINGFAKKYPHWLSWWAYRILRHDCPPCAEIYRVRDRELSAPGGWAFKLQRPYQIQIVRWWIAMVLR